MAYGYLIIASMSDLKKLVLDVEHLIAKARINHGIRKNDIAKEIGLSSSDFSNAFSISRIENILLQAKKVLETDSLLQKIKSNKMKLSKTELKEKNRTK